MIKIKYVRKKGYTLVEIMIVLGIISVALVGAIGTMVRASYQLRLNEVEDTGNAFILKASEFLRSPALITVRNYPGNEILNTNNRFTLGQDVNTSELYLDVANSNQFSSECNENNPFNVKNILGDEVLIPADICMQIIIEANPRNNKSALYSFEITMKYEAGAQEVERKLFGYRYGNIAAQ